MGGVYSHTDDQEGIAPKNKVETIDTDIPYQKIHTTLVIAAISPPHHIKSTQDAPTEYKGVRYHLEHAVKGGAAARGETVAPISPAILDDESC